MNTQNTNDLLQFAYLAFKANNNETFNYLVGPGSTITFEFIVCLFVYLLLFRASWDV